MLLAVVAVWVVGELVALVILSQLEPLPADDIARLYRPHPYRVYMFAARRRSARGHCSINSHGFRGPEIELQKPLGTVRIACLGSSTTFDDTATTDGHTYPAHLERFLREHYVKHGGRPARIEVINAGVPGYTSLESLIYFESKLLDYELDIAIFHHGLDDALFMACFREFAGDYVHARKVFRLPKPHLWERSVLVSLLLPNQRSIANPYRSNRAATLAQLTVADPERLSVDEAEMRRCFRPERLAPFARNVRNFIYVARGHGVAPILSTVVCNPQLGFLADVVGQINTRIREIADSHEVPCVDLAREMAWSAGAFVDDWHLRDCPEGLERKGKIFAEHLIRNRLVDQVLENRRQGEKDR